MAIKDLALEEAKIRLMVMYKFKLLCACHRIVHEGSLEDRGLVGEVFVPGSLFSAVVKVSDKVSV